MMPISSRNLNHSSQQRVGVGIDPYDIVGRRVPALGICRHRTNLSQTQIPVIADLIRNLMVRLIV